MRDYNFFEPYSTKNKEKKLNEMSLSKYLLIFVILLSVVPAINFYLIYKLENETAQVNQLAYSSPDFLQRKTIEEKENKIRQMKTHHQQLLHLDESVTRMNMLNDLLLYTINDAIPNGLFFKSISIDGEKIQIQGSAKNRVAIAEFQHNLKKISDFQEVFVSTIAQDENAYTFDISFLIKDVSSHETN